MGTEEGLEGCLLLSRAGYFLFIKYYYVGRNAIYSVEVLLHDIILFNDRN